MKLLISTLSLLLLLTIGGLSSAFADDTPQQNLQPGQDGYVGALNDRPSNSFTTNSTSNSSNAITPNIMPGHWYDYEPSSIKVLVRTGNNPSASGTVKTYNFGTYLDDVLPNEWVASWPSNSLKAGAVSVRSYAWYCTNYPKYPSVGADLDNTVNSQVFKSGSALTSTTNAIKATVDEALVNVYTEVPGYYKAGTYGSGRDSSSYNIKNNAYQNGEHYWADQGKTYTWMLSYYYPGTSIVYGSGSAY
ncbi:SpoIID/LytB domain-containing protein [Pullulanibacillus sp. KACC 23026]|uniref:SpoIID/LytB domain-containing protein n=1 Tax=Pullulanibacillus sp. KACC 23026 TaxID=3028315 RepID=UPI0023B1DC62|nr:SpoIID/LytB domain-containing protein [Pullulanibacillus sp. KACC 23026]WEG12847.1 SpoIID/LytB domain-containing protein [Pullulanibacillus sp. KACC 23026]